MDLRQRTKEGIETARRNGKQIGGEKGTSYNIKEKEPVKEKIVKLSKTFGGVLTDQDTMKLIPLNKDTYYKYKREILQNPEKYLGNKTGKCIITIVVFKKRSV